MKTGKAGLLGFAGHEHIIRARSFWGRVVYYPAAPNRSLVEIDVATDGLEVVTPPDTAEIRKVTETMRHEVLDVAHYPVIRLTSGSVTPLAGGFHVEALLTMHGRTRSVPMDVAVVIDGDSLRAAASFALSQTDFGISPYRGGPAGTIRVANRIVFRIDVLAVRQKA